MKRNNYPTNDDGIIIRLMTDDDATVPGAELDVDVDVR